MAELILVFGLIAALVVLDRVLSRVEARHMASQQAASDLAAPVTVRAGRSVDAGGRPLLEVARAAPPASMSRTTEMLTRADAKPQPASHSRKADADLCGCLA